MRNLVEDTPSQSLETQARASLEVLNAIWQDSLEGHINIDESTRTKLTDLSIAIKAYCEQLEDVQHRQVVDPDDPSLRAELLNARIRLGRLSRKAELLCIAICEETHQDYVASHPRLSESIAELVQRLEKAISITLVLLSCLRECKPDSIRERNLRLGNGLSGKGE